MTLDTSCPETRFAIDTVRQAGALAAEVQRDLAGEALTKQDRSPVTVADFAVQAFVGRRLEETFPGAFLVGEERSAALQAEKAAPMLDRITGYVGRYLDGASPEAVCSWIDRGDAAPEGRFWVLDPVDGTKGFLRGEQYAVALALIIDDQVRLGVLACPNLTDAHRPEPGGPGTLVIAVRGQGAWAAPLASNAFARLSVSARSNPKDARVLRSVESGHTNVGRMGALLDLLGVEADPVLMDSQAKYALLAAGCGDLLFRLLSEKQPDYRERIWDQAAGSIVVEEAGGRISDLSGAPLDFTAGTRLENNRGVVASNGLLHDAALKALARLA